MARRRAERAAAAGRPAAAAAGLPPVEGPPVAGPPPPAPRTAARAGPLRLPVDCLRRVLTLLTGEDTARTDTVSLGWCEQSRADETWLATSA